MKSTSINHRIKQLASRIFPFLIKVDGGFSGRSAITFDDGPCRGVTESILDSLDRSGVKATFFLSGAEVEKDPELVREIDRRGHLLANHGYLHKNCRDIGVSEYVAGVIKTHELFESITGKKLKKYFRPPYGELNFNAMLRLMRNGYIYVMWSYDTRDSFVETADEIIRQLVDDRPRKSEIFLLHEDYPHTAKALPELVEKLQQSQHRFARIDEL